MSERGTTAGADLRTILDRAVGSGVITRDQADKVAALARADAASEPGALFRPGAGPPRPGPDGPGADDPGADDPRADGRGVDGRGVDGRGADGPGSAETAAQAAAHRPAAPVLAEVLGYLGGAVTIVTATVLGNELWDSLAVAVRVLVLVVVAAAATLAGAGLRDHRGPAGRLAGFLWLIAVVALAGTVAVAADGLLGWGHRDTALAACLVALGAALVLWWLRPETLQHLAVFVAALASIVAVFSRLDADAQEWAPVAVWAFGLGWLAATAAGRLRPASIGWVVGGLAAAFSLLLMDTPRSPWLVVAVLTGIGLVAVGVRGQRWPVVAIGVGGLLFAVPITLGELFGTALLPVWIALGIGLALLVGGVVVLLRPGRTP